MQNLDRRVAALEAQQDTGKSCDVIVVGFAAAGGPKPELQTLTNGSQTWRREDGETEEQFTARACAEVPRARACVPVLLAGSPEAHAAA